MVAVGVAFGLMSAFFMAGLYVAGALGVLSLIMMEFFNAYDTPLWNIMGNRAWEMFNNRFVFVAIPLFILMGELVLRSGIAERMYSVLARWLVFMPGGLIHANIASCAIFAACSGSSIATAATISRVALPSFRARSYNERLVIGSLAAGGTLGILIPPSIGFILYGLMAGVSIGRLFLAGFIPGAMLALSFMIMIGIAAVIWPGIAPREPAVSWRLRFSGLGGLLPILALIVMVLGSIYFGWATPSEAAGAGVTGALVLAMANTSGHLLRSRQYLAAVKANVRMLQQALLSTARTSAMIMFILMAAITLHFTFGILRISYEMAQWVSLFNLSSLQLVLILVVFYLLLGTFMEAYSMMLTTLPILLPVLIDADVDRLWFGVIMVMLLESAQVSPPQGLALYVLHGARTDVDLDLSESGTPAVPPGTINDVYIGVLPFMGCMALVIGLVIAFPEIATWLPDQVKGAR